MAAAISGFMTARDPKEPTGFVNDHPAVPSMIAKVIEGRQRGLPNYVAGMDAGRQGIDTFTFGSAYLGGSTEPFNVPGDPSSPKFTIENLAAAGRPRNATASDCSGSSTPGAASSTRPAISIRSINSIAERSNW